MNASNPNLEGKTCLITGATNGIGRVTAVELARMRAELFLVYRDKARADEVVAQIRMSTGNENVHLLHADLGSQRQIRNAATEFLATGRPLHLLINNAGLGNTKRIVTEDGIEMVFAVNHLAYLLPANDAAARPNQAERARTDRERRLGGASVWNDQFRRSRWRAELQNVRSLLSVEACEHPFQL